MLNLTKGSTARERELETEVRRLRQHVRALDRRLNELEAANWHIYDADNRKTGGACFDPRQPFGTDPKRKLGTLFMKGGTS